MALSCEPTSVYLSIKARRFQITAIRGSHGGTMPSHRQRQTKTTTAECSTHCTNTGCVRNDGYGAVAYIENGKCELVSRRWAFAPHGNKRKAHAKST